MGKVNVQKDLEKTNDYIIILNSLAMRRIQIQIMI